jgi:hypothetical protein
MSFPLLGGAHIGAMPIMIIFLYCSSFTCPWWLLPASAAATGREGGRHSKEALNVFFETEKNSTVRIQFCEETDKALFELQRK